MNVVAIGNFDGVHLGHQKLIEKTIFYAKKFKLKSRLITFERIFTIPQGQILTPITEKLKLLSQFSIDDIIVLPNQDWLWDMSAERFIDDVLLKLKPRLVVVGYNFKFGKDARGTVGLLSRFLERKDIAVKVISLIKYHNDIISSSYIRHLILNGKVNYANGLLNRAYGICGKTIKGKGIAKKLGFPTINLKIDEDKLIPTGVLSGFASDGSKNYKSIIYIGKSPTTKKQLEFHILEDIKPSTVKKKFWEVYITQKIRDEKKFKSINDLKKQIKKDIIIATKWLGG